MELQLSETKQKLRPCFRSLDLTYEWTFCVTEVPVTATVWHRKHFCSMFPDVVQQLLTTRWFLILLAFFLLQTLHEGLRGAMKADMSSCAWEQRSPALPGSATGGRRTVGIIVTSLNGPSVFQFPVDSPPGLSLSEAEWRRFLFRLRVDVSLQTDTPVKSINEISSQPDQLINSWLLIIFLSLNHGELRLSD